MTILMVSSLTRSDIIDTLTGPFLESLQWTAFGLPQVGFCGNVLAKFTLERSNPRYYL